MNSVWVKIVGICSAIAVTLAGLLAVLVRRRETKAPLDVGVRDAVDRAEAAVIDEIEADSFREAERVRHVAEAGDDIEAAERAADLRG